MEIKQIYDIANQVVQEGLGSQEIAPVSAENIVDVGKTLSEFNWTSPFLDKMAAKVSKVVLTSRVYKGQAPNIMVDGFEWGSVVEKIDTELPSAELDKAYQIADGQSVDPYVVSMPKTQAKYYSDKQVWSIKLTRFKDQITHLFRSAADFEAFWAKVEIDLLNTYELEMQQLTLLAVDNMIGETVATDFSDGNYSAGSAVRSVNLLYEYNQIHTTDPATVANALTNPEFIRFANQRMKQVQKRMGTANTLFNIGGLMKFTQGDNFKFFLHNDYVAAADSYLYGDTYHDEKVALPDGYQSITHWQGIGKGFKFEDTSKIDLVTHSGRTVQLGGILGVMCDKYAVALYNKEEEVLTTPMNAAGKYLNIFHHYETSYINDFNENFVVFFIA